MKFLVLGLILAIIEGVIGYFFRGSISYETVFGTVSIILIGIAVLISGLAVSGDRQRANHYSETKENRQFRIKNTFNIVITAIPSLIILIVLLSTK
ncbi:DUF5316 family protein [Bacillus atrophaeus]|uniref:DUF5316 family protein n=2 Tax=Bacillus atrophaeus TaxID=1452 RepID=UPI00227E44A8|nr:DUF5316 family protein [Bacillus atrophaeus]MCY8827197.1 DUF5316 domain-containing protein [Bacillus atrophaeus]MCY8843406.1 DUF5316 domain-containing protein [Bacillus atrophaeus]MEC0806636.1 DUF5316 family protein [Bacillus atrophaeus]MEC0855379.1 DUF5316 family protein [Bacillus atrophaeus]MEC0863617.1 DUF5316 family protein [Bacillus atrophaeus]